MKPSIILLCFVLYSALLFFITWLTSRNANNESYFIGNKTSKWYIVAYGMIGASLSGVTFMSVPGWVGTTQFSYLVIVLGYLLGYTVIATVLMPMYYRLQLTSIYSYLEQRFGFWSYKTGSFFFIISRIIGASFRMFLVVDVLQKFVLDAWHVPFSITVGVFILLILLYTFKGGIKTIVWTDTLQTTFMLLGVFLSIIIISHKLNFSFGGLLTAVDNSGFSKIFFSDWHSKHFFVKDLLSGMFISIVMTGLDQEMMQKNLSCKNLKEAQKNMFTFSFVLVIVNLLFLYLGAVLYLYAKHQNIAIPTNTDMLFPNIAINYLGPFAGLIFVIGLISAAYPSADAALTALTTSFCIDFLGFEKNKFSDEKKKKRLRYLVHVAFAIVLLIVIVVFRVINNQAVIQKLFTIAGYTYGPLLGLYAFGLFMKQEVKDKWVPYVCLASPLLCFVISENSVKLLGGYKFGFELLILNGLFTFIGLLFLSKKRNSVEK